MIKDLLASIRAGPAPPIHGGGASCDEMPCAPAASTEVEELTYVGLGLLEFLECHNDLTEFPPANLWDPAEKHVAQGLVALCCVSASLDISQSWKEGAGWLVGARECTPRAGLVLRYASLDIRRAPYVYPAAL